MFIDTVKDIWEQDDLEDSIFNALYALNEEQFVEYGVGRAYTFRDNMMAKAMGCYFPPKNRVFYTNCIDIKNDGLPGACSLSGFGDFFFQPEQAPTLSTALVFPIKQLPTGMKSAFKGPLYKLIFWEFFEHGVPDNHLDEVHTLAGNLDANTRVVVGYVAVNEKTDAISPCYDKKAYVRGCYEVNRNWLKPLFATTVSAFNDAKHLWSVDLSYPFGKRGLRVWLKFGVHEEHIQSLFYARDLPVTAAGRKRPIQHWVKAHKRRMKSGTSIDIKRHLRGIDEFEMLGHSFIISHPRKQLSNCKLKEKEWFINKALKAPAYLNEGRIPWARERSLSEQYGDHSWRKSKSRR